MPPPPSKPKDKYDKMYKRNQPEEEQPKSHSKPVKRSLLEPEHKRAELIHHLKSEKLKVDKNENREVILNEKTEGKNQVFYCETCKVQLKDSQAYIDHINGKNHYKALGMSMVVEKVSVDRVKSRLAGLKRSK